MSNSSAGTTTPPKLRGGLHQEGTTQNLLALNLPCCRSPTQCQPMGVQRHRQIPHWSCTQSITYQPILIQKLLLKNLPFFLSSTVLQLLCNFGKKGRKEDAMLNGPDRSLAFSAFLLIRLRCFSWNRPSPELQQN